MLRDGFDILLPKVRLSCVYLSKRRHSRPQLFTNRSDRVEVIL